MEASSVVVADADSTSHDPLRHYRAVAAEGEWVVVGNGDHVDGVSSDLVAGLGPFEIMSTVSAEPDAPIFTPRIWIAVQRGRPQSAAILGHARRRADGGTTRCLWSVEDLAGNAGVLLTTYSATIDNVSVTDGPMYVSCNAESGADLLETVWDLLDSKLRVGAILIRPDANESISLAGPVIATAFG